MRVEVFIFTYNEGLILPHVLNYYQFAERITLLDGYSNDNTVELAKQYPNVIIRQVNSGGEINDEIHANLRNTVWKNSKADWVIIIDADEIIYSENLVERLTYCKQQGYDVIKTVGYNMFAREYPKNLLDIKDGVFDRYSCKPCIFNPKIESIGILAGGHELTNKNLKVYWDEDIKLLHYKYIGYSESLDKQIVNRTRKSKSDLAKGYGFHHNFSNKEFIDRMIEIDLTAENIFTEIYQNNLLPKFTIIMSTHGRFEKMKEAVASCLRQSYKNFELLVISDEPNPEKLNYLRSLKDDRIQYAEVAIPSTIKKNMGTLQKTAGSQVAKGDYLIYLDDDNILFKNCLANYAMYFCSPNVAMIIGKVIHNTAGFIPEFNEITVNHIDTLNFAIKKDIAIKFEWNHEVYATDYLFLKDCEKDINANNQEIYYGKFITGVHL